MRKHCDWSCSSFHEQLPAAGLKRDRMETSTQSLDKLYDNYLAASIKDNWKFYLYSFIMKPLFQRYKEQVSTQSLASFNASVEEWTTDTLSLSNLRRQTLENMRDITRKTDIMSNPASLPQQALASIGQLSDSTASTPPPPPPPSSEVNMSKSVASPPSAAVPHLSTPGAMSSSSSSPGVSQLAALLTSRPSAGTAPVPAAGPSGSPSASSQRFSALSAPLVSQSALSSAFTVPRATVLQDLISRFSNSAGKPSTPARDAQSQLLRSKPSGTSTRKRVSALNSNEMVSERSGDESTSTRKRVSSLSSSGTVSERSADESTSTRKRLSGLSSGGTVSERSGEECFSRRKRVSGQRSSRPAADYRPEDPRPVPVKQESPEGPAGQLSLSPVREVRPAPQPSPGHQAAGAVAIDVSDIRQLAASVQQTTLHVHPPVAVVTPSTSLSPPVAVVTPTLPSATTPSLAFPLPASSSMAHLITDSQYHEYDFDLTDIPLPDL